MPSKKHTITSSKWTQVTTNEESGSYLAIGHDPIYLYQGSSAPTETAGSAPMLDMVTNGQPVPFFDIPAGEAIWARTAEGKSVLHITGGKHASS